MESLNNRYLFFINEILLLLASRYLL
jgi:ribosome maturation factor RimP